MKFENNSFLKKCLEVLLEHTAPDYRNFIIAEVPEEFSNELKVSAWISDLFTRINKFFLGCVINKSIGKQLTIAIK